MTTLDECPWCQQPVDAANAGSDAEQFCTNDGCRKPLFMKPNAVDRAPEEAVEASTATANGQVVAVLDDRADPSRRRPRVRGVESLAMVECPHCDEPNMQTEATCHRCLKSLTLRGSDDSEGAGDASEGCKAARNTITDRPFPLPEWILISLGLVLVALSVRLVIVMLI